jgi:chitodextrinase
MAMFLYSAAMSLDGFIAGPGGDMSWLTNDLGPNPLVAVLITQVGAILVATEQSAETTPIEVKKVRARRSSAAYWTKCGHVHTAGDQPLVPRHCTAPPSACTPVTICDSMRFAHPNIN